MVADDDLVLQPVTTATGLLETMMIHETLSPLLPGYDKDDALRSMRLMRRCIENRCRHPDRFGVHGTQPGLQNAFAIITNRIAFGEFADTPNFSYKFIHWTNDIIALAHQPKDPRYQRCHDHVAFAILAATEPAPPAEAIGSRVYYWRTKKRGGPGVPTAYLMLTLQFNTFWGQSDIKD